MAHSRNINYGYISYLTERLGALGVISFLFIAGYYFNPWKVGVKSFFLKKITTIIIPWVFTGTIVYLVVNKFDILTWLSWLVGIGSYLYYLTILMVCYLVFSFVKDTRLVYIFLALNVLSLCFTSFGLLDAFIKNYSSYNTINNYLNFFNWAGFFALGILCKNNFDTILRTFDKYIMIILLSFLSLLFLGFLIEPNYGGYFSFLGLPCEVFGTILLFYCSKHRFFKKKIFHLLSDFTFTIYLIHFLVFPFRRILPQNQIFEFINPVCYLALSVILIYSGQLVFQKIKIPGTYSILFGLRNSNAESSLPKTSVI